MIDTYYYVLFNKRRKMYYEQDIFWEDNMEYCWATKLLTEAKEKKKELEEQLSTATMYHGCDTLVNELKQENQQLKEDLQAKDILVNTYMSVVGTLDNAKQLKQSQNQKAIEVLKKISPSLITTVVLAENRLQMEDQIDIIINNEIEELGGNNNE